MSLPFVRPEPGPVVRTPSGPVRGLWREHDGTRSAAFLGVPLAAPPVGALRFAAPQPPQPWDAVRECTAYGPTPQLRPLADVTFIPEPTIPGDDTLSLNVFTPRLEGRAPVLVWFHGGGYTAGSAASPWYDGRSFARDGVVVVTCSYRLGVDGFGVLDGAPANRGVLDWLAALRWVRDTIGAFGGDPDRVTIAGQSAGGGAVTTLLLTPQARGLFHGAIPQSGAFGPAPLASGQRLVRRAARRLGVEPTAAAFEPLHRDAVEATPEDDGPLALPRRLFAGGPGLGWGPVVDGDVVPRDLDAAYDAGAVPAVPLLVGCTAHEFTHQGPDAVAALADRTPAQALAELGADDDLAAQVLREHPDLDAARAVGQAVTELLFRRPAEHLARRHDAIGAPTFRYDVRWPVPSSGLAGHCCELAFVWDLLDADGVSTSYGPNPPQALADEMHDAWVRFVREGDPGWGPGEPRVFA